MQRAGGQSGQSAGAPLGDPALALAMLAGANVAVALVDGEGVCRHVTAGSMQLLGWAPAELIGTRFSEGFAKEDRARIEGILAEVVSRCGARSDGVQARHSDRCGRSRTIELSLTNRLDDPSLAGIIVVAREVSAEVEATARLEAALEQQAAVAQLGRRALQGADTALLALEAIEMVMRALKADGVELFHHIAGEAALVLEAAQGPTEGSAGAISLTMSSRAPEVTAVVERRPVIVDDLATDERFETAAARWSARTVSLLSVPVVGSHQPYGALSVHAHARRVFTPENAVFVQSIANALGLALDRRRAEEETLHRAFHDALTGLPNRTLLVHRLQRLLEARPDHRHDLGVFVVDLDHFKVVNDSLGHDVGDAMLVEVSRRLRETVRPHDMVARLGGDEFALLCEGLSDEGRVASIAERVLEAFEKPIEAAGRKIHVSASVGVALPAAETETPASLLRDADVALYQAKDKGRGGYALFEETQRARAVHRLEVESDLRRGVSGGELRLHYQPTFDLARGAVGGVEALVRWAHPTRGLVRPSEFIPVAEHTDLIDHVDRWVLTEACRQLAEWSSEPGAPDLTMSVNLSARQLDKPNLTDEVARVIVETRVNPSRLCLEITESAFMTDPENAAEVLFALKALGVRIAVDDFGTGFSSLSYLAHLPLDIVKIDRSFIAGIGLDAKYAALTRGIVDLAHSLELLVVAEGVETAEQLELLRSLGCDMAQGFLLANPEAASTLGSSRRLHADLGVIEL